ncbi:serine hydrolase domain-containing protein [Nonomuraea glycinis]|uniref:serine hydrolase domain-containing protein n=1 Tax=Nonomuraea glycinis TaxID=2047744 RepID=UPI002E138D6D|nr:beta-lactamase family protein [Nonomuraea glycinis]
MRSDDRIEAALARAVALGEVGVQVAAYLGGELIVDAWTGAADERDGRAVDGDTLFPVFSVSKALVATAIQVQCERGLVDLDEPIATYWPEYGQHGKEAVTVRQVLTHRAGVPHMPRDLDAAGLADRDAITAWLTGVEPLHPPGERSMYHSISFGHILGEVITRTDPSHRPYDRFLREELCLPLGADDVWDVLPAEHEPRVARLTWGANPPTRAPMTGVPLLSMPPEIRPDADRWNDPRFRSASIPAAGAVMSARAGARFFSMLANGGEFGGRRYVSADRLLALTTPRPGADEFDEVYQGPTWVGTGGFWLGGASPPADPLLGPSTQVLAHAGVGGSMGWADLATGLAVVITHNRMFLGAEPGAEPFVPLADAVRAVAGVD